MTAALPFSLTPANEATTTPERRGIARDGVRMLVTDRRAGTHRDSRFRALPDVLRPGDLLVANDSATLPAALRARRDGGETLALHLSTWLRDDLWLAEPRGSVVAGESLTLAEGATVTLLAPLDPERPRLWYTRIRARGPLAGVLARHGAPIRYRYVTDDLPLADYQTIFARVPGSAEMPSAGRPFTPEVLRALAQARIGVATITLHTGVSSPERSERPYRERYVVGADTAQAINATKRRGGRIVAIGTTVVRALETAAQGHGVRASHGWTDLIVTPERGVMVVDGLLTGFHEPEASHLDLLRAFVHDSVLCSAYEQAIERTYLWHEFGDVHLLV